MEVEQGAVTLVECALRAHLRGTVALWVNGYTRADLEGVFEGLLHSVPLICVLLLVLTFREVVFLLLLRPWGRGVLLNGWAGSTRGSQKVTCFCSLPQATMGRG